MNNTSKLSQFWAKVSKFTSETAWAVVNRAIHLKPHSDLETVIYASFGLATLIFAVLLNFELHIVAAKFLAHTLAVSALLFVVSWASFDLTFRLFNYLFKKKGSK